MTAAPDPYLQPYRDAQRRHGTSFDVTLWGSPQTQQARFDTITDMIHLPGKRILDAGCSRGDLAAHLIDRRIPYASYLGIDGVPEIIDHARTRNLPATRFITGDFVRQPRLLKTGNPQIITLSGTLNTMDLPTALTVLGAAWSATSETLIFNFLPDTCGPDAPPQKDPARRLPTFDLLTWALHHSPAIHYRQDYLPAGHDATIAMHKQPGHHDSLAPGATP